MVLHHSLSSFTFQAVTLHFKGCLSSKPETAARVCCQQMLGEAPWFETARKWNELFIVSVCGESILSM